MEGLEFEVVMEDIQTLNSMASQQKLDITKLSFPAFFQNQENYSMLHAGAALGKGVGPLLIAKKMVNVPDIIHSTIAIPGELTTANFLLSFAFPEAKNKTAFLFSEIEDAVQLGKVDLGVIIHENRFTYHQKGLIKVCDLGEVWEERHGLPIPLACIAAKNTIPEETRQKISELIRKSVEYVFSQYPDISDFTRQHAQSMEEEVMRKHIELYVNNYTVDLGNEGRQAVQTFRDIYNAMN
jgi:1,4-dihydroxy-6-naphthoate synthase